MSISHFIALNDLAKQSLKVLLRPIEQFFIQINDILRNLRRAFLQSKWKMKKKPALLKLLNGKTLFRKISNGMKRYILSKVASFQNSAKRAQKNLESFSRIVKLPGFLFRLLSTKAPIPTEKLLNAYRIACEDAQLSMIWLKEQSRHITESIAKQLSRWTTPLIKASKPRVNEFAKKMKRHSGRLKEFFNKKHQKAVSFLKTRQEFRIQRSRIQSIDYISLYKMTRWLPRKLQYFAEKLFLYFRVREIIQTLILIRDFSTRFFYRTSIAMLLFIPRAINSLYKGLFWAKQAFRNIRKRASTRLSSLLDSFRKIPEKILYCVLLAMIMLTILSFWGIKAWAQSMNRLTGKLLWRRS